MSAPHMNDEELEMGKQLTGGAKKSKKPRRKWKLKQSDLPELRILDGVIKSA